MDEFARLLILPCCYFVTKNSADQLYRIRSKSIRYTFRIVEMGTLEFQ